MGKDYSSEVKELIKKYKKEDIAYGKRLDLLLSRIGATQEEVENEILNCETLRFAEKQEKDGEARYALFFIYSNKRGRIYLITFRDRSLRVITIIPLGRLSVRRYLKRRFI